MKRFKFNLESVLVVRQKTLDDERKKLAQILEVLNKQKESLNRLISELNCLTKEADEHLLSNTYDVNLIANYSSFIDKTKKSIKAQEELISKKNLELEKQKEETKKAYINVKTLEKLKEKQLEQYKKEVLEEEFKIIDDIVSSKKSIA